MKKKTVVIGLFEDSKKVKVNPSFDEKLELLIKRKQLKLGLGEVNKVPTFQKDVELIWVVGLGKERDYDMKALRKAASTITSSLGEDFEVIVSTFLGKLNEEEGLKKLVLFANDYNYVFDRYKSDKKENKKLDILWTTERSFKKAPLIINEYTNVSESINMTRDLINTPHCDLNSEDLAAFVKKTFKELNNPKVEVSVLGRKEVTELKMGAFLAVNKGSKYEPQLIHLKFMNNPESEEVLGLVGKGLTFDTGGYSLKPSQFINDMKMDMGGAATVLGAFRAAVANNLKINLQLAVAATDNMVNEAAYLPDDIVTSMNGKTIEIISTDAEGRLTLADALTYIQKQGVTRVIDMATLTGAVIYALGHYTTGAFGNNKTFTNDIIKAGENELEELWELPINDSTKKGVKASKVADLLNATGRSVPGAQAAAAFLQEFINKGIKWIHLDIAGTAFRGTPLYGEHPGATGECVKTLYQYFKQNSK